MTKKHSRDTRLYVAGYDLSGDANALTLPRPRDLIEATAFGDTGEKNIVGPSRGSFSIDAMFDDTSGMDAALNAWLSEQIASFWPAGEAAGAFGVGSSQTILEGYPYSSRVADIVKVTANGRINGIPYRIKSLAAKQTVTAQTNSPSIDDGAASAGAGPGVFICHVTAISATGGSERWRARLQHSADNAAWSLVENHLFTNADGIQAKYVLFAAPSAPIGGLFERYVRLQMDLEATTGSITYQASYVRL